jgi:MFS family permease
LSPNAQDGERLGYVNLNIARIITGVGIGAVLAIVNTYINEVAPRHSRAKYTTVIFAMSAIGALLGIWLRLILTTPSTPWPMGLPFALASKSFGDGWRWMYRPRGSTRLHLGCTAVQAARVAALADQPGPHG